MFDTSTVPSWVSEGSIRKWHRAVAQLTKENGDRVKTNQPTVAVTEAALKELYVKWGGLVLGGDEPAAKTVDTPKAVKDMKVDELKAFAAEKNVDVTDLNKTEMIDKLTEAGY